MSRLLHLSIFHSTSSSPQSFTESQANERKPRNFFLHFILDLGTSAATATMVTRNALEEDQSGKTMAFVHELVSSTTFFVTRPLLLAQLSLLFGIRSVCMIILTWIELLRAAICCQLELLWEMMVWALAILSLPVRAWTALQREKMLEVRILEMQTALENILWQRKKLEQRLHKVIKERGLLEEHLAELEDELESTIHKMELLEVELHDLKAGTLRLDEVHHEGVRCSRFHHECNMGSSKTVQDVDKLGISLLRSGNGGRHVRWRNGSRKSKSEINDVDREALKYSTGLTQPSSDNALDESREIALSRSLFSAILSLFVGIIAWEAKDPCMPLVGALFCVVGISLAGVLHFLSSIQNKPAVDAVLLLSLNCFMLGTLTYPTLPKVADALAPFLCRAAEEIFK